MIEPTRLELTNIKVKYNMILLNSTSAHGRHRQLVTTVYIIAMHGPAAHITASISACSPGRRWSVGGGEGRSSLGRQEGVPADVVRGKEEEGGG